MSSLRKTFAEVGHEEGRKCQKRCLRVEIMSFVGPNLSNMVVHIFFFVRKRYIH